MAFLNTKKSALFLLAGAVLPTPPTNFLEVADEFVINPNPKTEEFNRISSLLGGTDSYADTCHVTFSQQFSHMMRTNNKLADALDTSPLCAELFKVCGFDEVKTADTVTYVNSQAPQVGSTVFNIDGKQFTSTASTVGDASFEFGIGKPAKFNATLQGFLDNEGIPTNVASPSVSLSDEELIMMTCADVVLADGTSVQCDKVTIAMGAQISEKYALGVKTNQMTDYVIKVTADFFVDSANYADAQTKLIAQDVDSISIKLNTANGVMQDGKSLLVTMGKCKTSTYQDSTNESTVKRSQTWLARPTTASGENIKIQYGNFA